MRFRALIAAFLALCMGLFLTACSDAASATDTSALTYDQIRNTGLANNCPQINEIRRGTISIDKSQSYVLTELCMQPTRFFVKEESGNKRQAPQYVEGKVVTRKTSSLDQVSGDLKIGSDGSFVFEEKDGFDFQAITIKLPGGELVPMLFTVKGLVAKSQPGFDSITSSVDFEGSYKVPSYRTSNFLDPKGRGLTTGYDNAVALPAAADSEEILKENMKRFDVGEGNISFQIAKINGSTGEIAGTFETIQPSDTDMGGKAPKELKIQGLFYGRVEPKA